MPSIVEFEWTRDSAGYRIETRRRQPGLLLPPDGKEYDCVVAKGGPPQTYRPLDDEPALFAILAATEPTAEGVMGFATSYGFLWCEGEGFTDPEGWRRYIESIRAAVEAVERGDYEAVARMFNDAQDGDLNIRLGLVRGRERPALHLAPPNLLSGLWLQIAQHVTSDHQFRRCLHCGTGFVYGSGTGRRRSGHYCSDRCRKAAWMTNQEQAT